MNRDNNLGMWSRGPGDESTESGMEYTDEMSTTATIIPPSLFLLLLSSTTIFTVIL